MAFRFSELGPLVISKPEEAADRLAAALAENGTDLGKTAKALEVDYRTLTRWLGRLLRGGLDVRHMALEKRADARVLDLAAGKVPEPVVPKKGRPFSRMRAAAAAR